MHKKIKNKEGVELEYIDLDILLGMMIDEYRSQRRQIQKDLQKAFMREMESTVSEIDLNTYIGIIDHVMPPINEDIMQENPLIKYSGPIS